MAADENVSSVWSDKETVTFLFHIFNKYKTLFLACFLHFSIVSFDWSALNYACCFAPSAVIDYMMEEEAWWQPANPCANRLCLLSVFQDLIVLCC